MSKEEYKKKEKEIGWWFFGMFTFFGLFIYWGLTNPRPVEIKKRLAIVTSDSLNQIIIYPTNLDSPHNLTKKKIRISDKKDIQEIINILSKINENFKHRSTPKTWDCYLILDYKESSDIELRVRETYYGICAEFPSFPIKKYFANELKEKLERHAKYNEEISQ